MTREIASFPEGSNLDSFGWRISMAEIRQGGAFSTFPGVDRQLAVLDGRLLLTIQGRRTTELSPESSVVSFPADVLCSARPLSALITDLNLMTRRGHFSSSMERRALNTDEKLRTSDADVTAVIALRSLGVQLAGNEFELSSRDAVVLVRGEFNSVRLHSQSRAEDEYILIKINAST